MSDVSIRGDVMRRLSPRARFQAADDRETPPADNAKGRPAGWREPPRPPAPHRRDDAESGPRPSSGRRLPTGLY